ncbi:MAG: T9SS type A sorting domain-containing protein [Candidatus Cloacimonetes bacterium]|nr:T9SS type A sorting domain-containing protein [Candidatus Cloacimonadota bacterium]
MRRAFMVILLLVIIIQVNAANQWPNPAVVTRENPNSVPSTGVQTEDGVVMVMQNALDGYIKLYAQKYNETGEKLWGDNGVLINTQVKNHIAFSLILSDNNSVIITWLEKPLNLDSAFQTEYRGQKISSNGQRLWADAGIQLTDGISEYQTSRTISDNQGGFYFCVNLWSGEEYLHYNSNGIYTHTVNLPLNSPDYITYIPEMILIPDFGFMIVYQTSNRPYISAYTETGEVIWDGISPFSSTDNYYFNDIGYIKSGDEFLFYIVSHVTNIRIQKINSAGEKLLGEEGLVLYQGTEYIPELNAVKKDNYWIMAAVKLNSILVFKLDFNANTLWDAPYVIQDSSYSEPFIQINDNADIYISYISAGLTSHLKNTGKIVKLSSEGQAIYPEISRVITFVNHYITHFDCFLMNNHLFYYWNDKSDRAIYCQVLNPTNQFLFTNGPAFLHKAGNVDITDIKIYSSESSVYVIWREQFTGYDRLYRYQIIDSNGLCVLQESGRLLTDNHRDQELSEVRTDSNGCLVVWYHEVQDSLLWGKVQKIDNAGNKLFGPEGLTLYHIEMPHYSCETVYNHTLYIDGNTCYFYYNFGNMPDTNAGIFGQKIVDDQIMWEPNGRLILNHFYTGIRTVGILSTCMNHNMIAWSESDYTWGLGNPEIRILKLNDEGQPDNGWTTGGKMVFNYPVYSISKLCITEYPEGFVILGSTSSDINDNARCYYQIVNFNGDIQLAQASLLFTDNEMIVNKAYWDNQLNIIIERNTEYDRYVKVIAYGISGNSLIPFYPEPVLMTDELLWQNRYDTGFSYDYSFVTYPQNSNIMLRILNENAQTIGSDWTVFQNPNYGVRIVAAAQNDPEYAYVCWDNRICLNEYEYFNRLLLQKVTFEPNSVSDLTNNKPTIILNQNRPNPFNPETTISYELNIESKIELKIYNVKGQKIKTLLSEIQTTGTHSVIWDGRDNKGEMVSSGIYFYLIESEHEQHIRKMLLLK